MGVMSTTDLIPLLLGMSPVLALKQQAAMCGLPVDRAPADHHQNEARTNSSS